MTGKATSFASEAELCAAFIEAAGENWTAYAETGGFDIVMVRKMDGLQIGVEAKLRLNAEVIGQAVEQRWWYDDAGPDFRAVLVPYNRDSGPISAIAAYIGITVIRVWPKGRFLSERAQFQPDLPKIGGHYLEDRWHDLCTAKRIKLPEYVPDVAAGSPAPLQLTVWKIGAIKIAIILELRGTVTRADFRNVHIDHRRWMARELGWLQPGEHGFIAGPRLPNFRAMHPVNYEQIKADAEKWLPPELVPASDKVPA